MKSFQEWLQENWVEDNICPPPMGSQKALDYLCYYLLGPDWYVNLPINSEQVNTEIVGAILEQYSKTYKKELKQMKKANRK